MLFMVRVCIHVIVFVPPVGQTKGKQVDPKEGCQASGDIIPCFLNCFHDDGSIADEECDDGSMPNGSTVAPDLVLGANDGDKHPQYIQHYQEDRSQQDKGDVKRDIGKGLVTGMKR